MALNAISTLVAVTALVGSDPAVVRTPSICERVLLLGRAAGACASPMLSTLVGRHRTERLRGRLEATVGRVLIVDDDALVRAVLRRAVEGDGHLVTLAADG